MMRYTNNASKILCNAAGLAFATLPIVAAPTPQGWNEVPTGGSGAAKATPEWAAVTYQAPVALSSYSFNGSNEIILDGLNIRSTDSGTPAVNIWHPNGFDAASGKKVIIRNCVIEHAGVAISGIGCQWTHLEVYNCFFRRITATSSVNPRVLAVQEFRSVTFEHNYSEGGAGIICFLSPGTQSKALYESVTVRFNKFRNINGMANGVSNIAQTLQLDGAVGSAGVATIRGDIGWNETINTEGQCHVEDNYNFFNVRGSAANPVRVHHNFISGAFYENYTTNNYTGGGIITDSPNSTQASMTAYLNVEYNRVIRTMNYCLGMATCSYTNYRHNRFMAASKFFDGSDYNFQVSGIWAKEYYPESGGSSNNTVHDNYGGTRTYWGAKQDYNNIPDANGNTIAVFQDNGAVTETVTPQHEQAEQTAWNAQLSAANVTLGPIIQS